MKHACFLISALAAAACSPKSDAPAASASAAPSEIVATETVVAAPPILEPLWIAEGFFAPEGVAAAPGGGYFISNVGGEETDGDGYVSKLGPDGAVIAERFIDGIDGPKGMAVLGGVLYVADNVRVRTYDAATGAARAVIEIPGATFLNDATLWNNEIYVSDSATGRIWRLAAEGPALWREGEQLSGVNGLTGDGDRMLVSTMTSGSLFEATTGGGWREIAKGMIDADGIGVVPGEAGGGYLVSSWPGDIHYVAPDGAATKILDTRAEGVLQNDLTTFGDVVIVPNWEPGTVTAWRVKASN